MGCTSRRLDEDVHVLAIDSRCIETSNCCFDVNSEFKSCTCTVFKVKWEQGQERQKMRNAESKFRDIQYLEEKDKNVEIAVEKANVAGPKVSYIIDTVHSWHKRKISLTGPRKARSL